MVLLLCWIIPVVFPLKSFLAFSLSFFRFSSSTTGIADADDEDSQCFCDSIADSSSGFFVGSARKKIFSETGKVIFVKLDLNWIYLKEICLEFNFKLGHEKEKERERESAWVTKFELNSYSEAKEEETDLRRDGNCRFPESEWTWIKLI